MIGYLKGNLIRAEDGAVLLETGGVGFEVLCSAAAFAEILKNGGGEVYVYTAVKEDGISLYGFISPEEKKIFLQLISVSGVGPKMGIAVLSSLSATELRFKIASGDVKGLSSVKGLGRKTAERIVLELQDKIGAPNAGASAPLSENVLVDAAEDEDAVLALMSLGFSKAESAGAVRKAKIAGAVTVKEIIALALKSMR